MVELNEQEELILKNAYDADKNGNPNTSWYLQNSDPELFELNSRGFNNLESYEFIDIHEPKPIGIRYYSIRKKGKDYLNSK